MGGSRVSTRSTTRNGEQKQVPGILGLKGGKHGKPRVGQYSEVEPYAQTTRPSHTKFFPHSAEDAAGLESGTRELGDTEAWAAASAWAMGVGWTGAQAKGGELTAGSGTK